MKLSRSILAAASTLALAGVGIDANAQSFSEGFETPGTLPTGWVVTNLSTRASTGNTWNVIDGITDADDNIIVPPFDGAGFAAANYTSIGSGTGTINNWLISPEILGIKNGDTFSFFTTTTPDAAYPDRLQVRLSTAGASTSVGTGVNGIGDFTTLMLDINPTLAASTYPEGWTQYTVTVSGLAGPVDGRLAFRYFVTAGGPTGANSNIVGVDDFAYTASAVPEPATWALMAGGFGLLCVRRLRNQASKA